MGENNWFDSPAGLALQGQAMATVMPWLWPICGHNALLLKASRQSPVPDLQCTAHISLVREHQRFSGDAMADDRRLPLSAECISLVLAGFVLESAIQPEALISECERVLLPEGYLALLTLNPFSPSRLRGNWRHLELHGAAFWQRMLHQQGLEPVRLESIGAATRPKAMRSVNFLLARKRKAALTPIRKNQSAVALATQSQQT
jgi:SAM-dependent methyltransferase